MVDVIETREGRGPVLSHPLVSGFLSMSPSDGVPRFLTSDNQNNGAFSCTL